jgi:hypothetical protein
VSETRPRTRTRRTVVRVIGPALVILVGAVVIARIATPAPGSGLVLEHAGVLADHPFDTPAPASALIPTFRPGGTATGSGGSIGVGGGGLNVAVAAHRPGTWKGYYAATAATFPANSVIHVRMSRPPRAALGKSQSGIVLLAVQTAASDALDYVLVANVATRRGTAWIVGHANGNARFATTTLLASVPATAPTRDVTLRTDGDSRYAVYFGSKLVYTSNKLRLNVAPPLRVYLEVQAKGAAYQALFQNFWVAASNTVTVNGLHPGDRLTLTPDGRAPIRAIADAAGHARLPVPIAHAVGTGTLTVASPHQTGARTFAGLAYAGGDTYRLRD